MEQRSHRLAVLLLVAVLHVPAFFALRDWLVPRAGSEAYQPLMVEFVLNEPAAAPPPMPRRATPRHSRENGNPVNSPRRPSAPGEPTSPGPRVRGDDEAVRLFSNDGALRIPSTLSDDIAAKPAPEPSNSFHIPAGDTWVLREPAAPIEFRDTRFAKGYMPESMNPVEEACWRNKGLAFVLAVLGSQDCAAPGEKTRVPPPELIVYGVDDGDEILRKHDAWSRYDER